MKTLEKMPGETARDYAIREIRENIISLDLEPGTGISENEIAGALGLSRTPVREAIQELNKASIIEIFPQRGSYVSLIDPKLVEEARFLRKVLDTAVIEKACELAENTDIAKLEENVSLQEFYLQNAAAKRIYELDNEFHQMIYFAAKKDTLYSLRSTIMIHFDRVRSLSMTTVKDMKIVNDHRQMLEAIKNKDSELAKQLVDKHLNRYQIDEAEIRQTHPEYFKV
ncbi:MAG: GntR family transcriptional regulator [Clostridia bacterium]|mgnify:CR=1 FL=1|nr:GntR family transcriptional regulator [Clostridia bacterium]